MLRADTIFALSSGVGKAAIAVVRLSGPAVPRVLEEMLGSVPRPRRAALRSIRDRNGLVLDEGLVLYFPAPRSETGEHLCEFQVHGGRAVVAALLADLQKRDGLRLAEPGEFARRALFNGKMDLIEAEALGDLLDSETELQRRQALGIGTVGLRKRAEEWREQLIAVSAHLVADLDFSDEGDVPESLMRRVAQQLGDVHSSISQALRTAHAGERIRDGVSVVLAGAPNVGKSSLMNALAGRDVAIVTDIPGTTRDRIEVVFDWEGVPIRLTDTAGIRDSSDMVESLGIERSLGAVAEADIVITLQSAGADAIKVTTKAQIIQVWTKADLQAPPDESLGVSVVTGIGLSQLKSDVARCALDLVGMEPAVVTHRRQMNALNRCLGSLRDAQLSVSAPEICAEHIRFACGAIDALIGRIGVEDMLDAVFSRFCIGK